MNKLSKIIAATIGGAFLILMVTNPSKRDFDDYLGIGNNPRGEIWSYKINNNVIFSTYKYEFYKKTGQDSGTFVGIFGRFYLVEGKRFQISNWDK